MDLLSEIALSDLTRFSHLPEAILQESADFQLAAANFVETPRNLLVSF